VLLGILRYLHGLMLYGVAGRGCWVVGFIRAAPSVS